MATATIERFHINWKILTPIVVAPVMTTTRDKSTKIINQIVGVNSMTRLQIRKKLHKAVLGKSFTGYYVREKLLLGSLLATKKIATKTTVKAFGLQTASVGIATLTVSGVATFQTTSYAATVGFTSSANLNADDSVNWANLGASFTDVPNPFSINSNNGNTLNVSQQGGSSFERRDQDNGWGGNFSSGNSLLSTLSTNGPITIDFANPVTRVGTQIQADYYGAFNATITAFDNVGNTLGSFARAGNSNGAGDGSAIFLGIGTDDTISKIYRVVFSVPNASFNPQDFAINNLSLRTEPVPEPLTILGTIAAGSIGVALRRKAKKQEC